MALYRVHSQIFRGEVACGPVSRRRFFVAGGGLWPCIAFIHRFFGVIAGGGLWLWPCIAFIHRFFGVIAGGGLWPCIAFIHRFFGVIAGGGLWPCIAFIRRFFGVIAGGGLWPCIALIYNCSMSVSECEFFKVLDMWPTSGSRTSVDLYGECFL